MSVIWRSAFSLSKIDFTITLTSIRPHFYLLLRRSFLVLSSPTSFPHSCNSKNKYLLLFFSLSLSLSLYGLVRVLGGQSIKCSQGGDPAASLQARETSTVAASEEVENGSPSHCLGFPAGLFLVHIGLSYKDLEAKAHADK